MCQIKKALFFTEKGRFPGYFEVAAQAIAQVVRGRLRRFLLSGTAVLFLACAGQVRETGSMGTFQAEAVLASGKYFFIFDFTHSRYQKWPILDGNLNLPEGSVNVPEGNSALACGILDSLQGNWSNAIHWLALPAATQPFQPIRAISGPNGNFFLLDRASKRLALYDTNAQFVSGIPLPPDIRDRNLNNIEVYWTRDGLFSFLDRTEAKVWKFSELRTAGGSGDWQLRYALNLSLGMDACLWEPYFKHPVCLRKGSSPIVFDDYFSPSNQKFILPSRGGIQARPEPDGTNWGLVFHPDSACATHSTYFYSPIAGGFFPDSIPQTHQPGSIPFHP